MKNQTLSFEKWKLTAPFISAEAAWKFQEGIILHLKETFTRLASHTKEVNEKTTIHMLQLQEENNSLKGQIAQLKKEIKELS